ncbi:hypothetical protein L195_g064226, partial [Trifolium pratense]
MRARAGRRTRRTGRKWQKPGSHSGCVPALGANGRSQDRILDACPRWAQNMLRWAQMAEA